MKTVRVALDESLVQELDRAARALGTTRSTFAQAALRDALGLLRKQEWEHQHRAGYEKEPVQQGETLHLASIPGVKESILEGMNTPIEKCEEDLDW